MSFPSGVETRKVSFGPAFHVGTGNPLIIDVLVRGSRSAVWEPTGERLRWTWSESGMPASETAVELPVSAQEGLGSEPLTYTATLFYLDTELRQVGSVDVGEFEVESGEGVVELDFDIPSTPGIAHSDVWLGAVMGGGDTEVHWSDVLGKPIPASDVHWNTYGGNLETGLGLLNDVVADLMQDKAPVEHTHTWGEVTDKPASFPPATHSHDWDEVAGKPATFPPATHGHAVADVTGLQALVDDFETRIAALEAAAAG